LRKILKLKVGCDKPQTGNNRFGNRLAEGIIIGCSSLSAIVPADEQKSAFVFTFGFSFSIG
jgi:hypothetical protein